MAIKKLQNDYTTPEQSKRLLELGVPADSADCYYLSLGKNTSNFGLPKYCYKPYTELSTYDYSAIYALLPCWTVGRLIEIFEICYGEKFCRWSYLPTLVDDCIEHIEFFKSPKSIKKMDFSKLED